MRNLSEVATLPSRIAVPCTVYHSAVKRCDCSMCEVKGKVVVVTGGAAGIGACVVKEFLERGAKHVVAADISDEAGRELEGELNFKHGSNKFTFIKCDVTKDLDAVYEDIIKEHGYIDVIVNNAGIMNDDPNVYLKEIAINMTAVISSSLTAYSKMRKDRGGKGGTIINISSIVALTQYSTLPVYSATKSAVLQFSNCLGMPQNYTRSGVRVITVCFGCTDTLLMSNVKFGAFDEDVYEMMIQALEKTPKQTAEEAARGLLEAYQQAESGSTWLVTSGKMAENITEKIKEAYKITSQGIGL